MERNIIIPAPIIIHRIGKLRRFRGINWRRRSKSIMYQDIMKTGLCQDEIFRISREFQKRQTNLDNLFKFAIILEVDRKHLFKTYLVKIMELGKGVLRRPP